MSCNLQRVEVRGLARFDENHLAKRSAIRISRTEIWAACVEARLRSAGARSIQWIICVGCSRNMAYEVADIRGLQDNLSGQLLLDGHIELIGRGPLIVWIDRFYRCPGKKARACGA